MGNFIDAETWFDNLDRGDQELLIERTNDFSTDEGYIDYLKSWGLNDGQASEAAAYINTLEGANSDLYDDDDTDDWG